MKILITGGLGYIGGRVATFLKVKAPDSDILLTTRDKNRRPHWADGFLVLKMDLLNEDSVESCLKGKNIDAIIHLAALNEIDSEKDPESALEVNSIGTYRLLRQANKYNISKFIYFSTFHVYGEVSVPVISEEAPTRSIHPYAFTHRAAEDCVNYFRHYHKMKTLILRVSNGYGYPVDKEVNRWSLVFNDLCRQAVSSGRIILKSSGKQYRDFIPLHDVARAVYHFLFIAPDKWQDGLFNLGGDCSMSIIEVARVIARVYEQEYKKELPAIQYKEDIRQESKPVRYSIEKIKSTGFVLEGAMADEIKKTFLVCEKF